MSIPTIRRIRYGQYAAWFNDTIPPQAPKSEKQLRQESSKALKERHAKKREEKAAAEREKMLEECNHPSKYIMPSMEVMLARRERALAEGGVARLEQLETHLRAYNKLTEPEWEQLTRLRAGLYPKKFSIMMSKPAKFNK